MIEMLQQEKEKISGKHKPVQDPMESLLRLNEAI